jgi:hypothetical protein
MNNVKRSMFAERRTYLMKNWFTKNKALTFMLVMVVLGFLVAVVAGPGIWSAFLAAHGL